MVEAIIVALLLGAVNLLWITLFIREEGNHTERDAAGIYFPA